MFPGENNLGWGTHILQFPLYPTCYYKERVTCDQLEPSVHCSLPLVSPVGVGNMSKREFSLQSKPALFSSPTQHLQGQFPNPDIIHLSLHRNLLPSRSAPGSLHRDNLLRVLVHLLQGGLYPGLSLPDLLPVQVCARRNLEQPGEQERIFSDPLNRNLNRKILKYQCLLPGICPVLNVDLYEIMRNTILKSFTRPENLTKT